MLADQPPGHIPPYLRAQLARGRALTAAAGGDHDTVEADLHAAINVFRSLGYLDWLARAQTDLAAWLIDQGRNNNAQEVLGVAISTLETLGAAPALAHARAFKAVVAAGPVRSPL